YNGTGAAIDLAQAAYNIQMYFNGSVSPGLTINLAGVVANGDVFVLAQSSADNTLRRDPSICGGDVAPSDAFDPALGWTGLATDTFDGLGVHAANCGGQDSAPAVSSTFPLNGATDFPAGANLIVSFSEPVTVSSASFKLTCLPSGDRTVLVSGGPVTYTLDPTVDLVPGETCTLTVVAAGVADQDTNDPPDNMLADHVVGFAALDACPLPY